jgi:3-hydroxyethyl bacteriochlorophyllide a dehydrogenase
LTLSKEARRLRGSVKPQVQRMNTVAVVLEKPEQLVLSTLQLSPPGDEDVVVDIEWSGISTGTERLLWSGRMPPFPGMGYPLVPGYESVGRVTSAGATSGGTVGDRVFVGGASCFGEIRGLFGGAASRLVVSGKRIVPIEDDLGEKGVLIALAATAHHAIAGGKLPDLIVGHGVLGRLLARIALALGGEPPLVWELNPDRAAGALGYRVEAPETGERGKFRSIYDVSGDPKLLDTLIAWLAPRGEIVLAGFYATALSFAFPPAFMKEARLRVAAEWQPGDLAAVKALISSGRLSLDGLITHRQPARDADAAYRTAFSDPACLKMILDWRAVT